MKASMKPLNSLSRSRTAALVLYMGMATATSAWSAPASPYDGPTAEQSLQLGLEAQAALEFREMLRLLRTAAGQGNVEAQEMLGMALLVGPTLYGPAVKADRCEAGFWLRKAVAQGSQAGKVQLDFLNRLRNSPRGQNVCKAWGG